MAHQMYFVSVRGREAEPVRLGGEWKEPRHEFKSAGRRQKA